MLKDLVLKNRSYRRFDERISIDQATLKELVELARISGSGANLQPIRYWLSWMPEDNEKIFPLLAWAGYLRDVWAGPVVGERPTAYIILLGDTAVSKSFAVDEGIVAQSILLGAVEKGLGGCMIASVKKDELRSVLNIPERYEILLAIALGKPAETVVLEPLPADGSIKYWRDAAEVHHVPKRSLDDLIIS